MDAHVSAAATAQQGKRNQPLILLHSKAPFSALFIVSMAMLAAGWGMDWSCVVVWRSSSLPEY